VLLLKNVLQAAALCGLVSIAACSRSPQPAEAPPAAKAAASAPSAPAAGATVEWPYYRGNLGSQHYSPLDQINASNVSKLEVAWRFTTANYGPKPESRNETTPLMIDGVLYTTVGTTRNVVAVDPKSGELLWVWRPNDGEARYKAAPRKTSGRGVARWSDGAGHDRLFVVTPGFNLAALDPDTGRPVPGFGENGVVDLMIGVRGEVTAKTSIGNSSPAIVVGDVVIVGPAHDVGMRPPSQKNLKGDVRGYDARSGKLLWTFHTIPAKGEPGYETWLNGSAETASNAGVWAPMAADAELGYVYLPVEAPLADTYGGVRPGNNVYGNSLVCLDAKTGRVVWYYQMIHHDIWDWDNPTSPILMDLVVDGKPIKAVAQITKQSFVYTFDRANGKPVWPIEERPVGKTDVPGEVTSPTQPFPTKPPAFDRQGFTDDDLIDFTPALRAEAVEGTKAFRKGPIFTPPSLANAADGTSGTLMLPSFTGGANWEGGSFDPETGLLYIGSYTQPSIGVLHPEPQFSDMQYIAGGGAQLPWLNGLPVVKPPYGRITALDMNKGELKFQIANGPTPKEIAENTALKGVTIAPTGRTTRAVTLVTKTLLFTAEGWGGTPILTARDKLTGDPIADIKLPGPTGGLPMTYMLDGKQYIVVSVGGPNGAELVALAFP
jgi:glucose dehydrogenase